MVQNKKLQVKPQKIGFRRILLSVRNCFKPGTAVWKDGLDIIKWLGFFPRFFVGKEIWSYFAKTFMQNWRQTNNKRQNGLIKSNEGEWDGHGGSSRISLVPENPGWNAYWILRRNPWKTSERNHYISLANDRSEWIHTYTIHRVMLQIAFRLFQMIKAWYHWCNFLLGLSCPNMRILSVLSQIYSKKAGSKNMNGCREE